MLKPMLAWLAAGLALAPPLHAQPAPQPAPLHLQQALDAAADNLDVSLARRALAAARADVAAADHAPAPVLSAKAAAIDLQNGIGPGNLLRDKRIDKSVGLDWTWERGDKRALRTRAATALAEAVAADLREAQVQQRIAAAAAYYDLLAAQERLQHTEAIAASAQQLAATAQRRVQAGDLSRQELARSEIEAQRALADQRAAAAERERAALALAQLTSRGPALRAEDGWPQAEEAPPASVDQRADLVAAQRRVEAAEATLAGALALRRNDVTVGASIDHFPGTSTRQLELRASIPLAGTLGSYGFDGEIARARAQLEQAQDQLARLRRTAEADQRRLQQELQSATARVRSYDTAIVPRARQLAGMAELAYSRGATPLADLLDARRTLRAVLLEEVAAHADQARAWSAWQLRVAGAERLP